MPLHHTNAIQGYQVITRASCLDKDTWQFTGSGLLVHDGSGCVGAFGSMDAITAVLNLIELITDYGFVQSKNYAIQMYVLGMWKYGRKNCCDQLDRTSHGLCVCAIIGLCNIKVPGKLEKAAAAPTTPPNT